MPRKKTGFFDAAEDLFERYEEETLNAIGAIPDVARAYGQLSEDFEVGLERAVRRSWMDDDEYAEWEGQG